MASLNRVMLIGRLGRDPDIRYTQSGNAVVNFSIATTERWKDRQGERQERTEWHDIVAWDHLADLVQTHLKKGSQIYVEGRLQTRNWEDKQGERHYRTEVVLTNMQFLDSRPSGDGISEGSYGSSAGSSEPRESVYSQTPSSNPPAQTIDDDMPF